MRKVYIPIFSQKIQINLNSLLLFMVAMFFGLSFTLKATGQELIETRITRLHLLQRH